MLQGEDIICIANTSWFGNYAKSTVQILERLAQTNRVLFVEYPYTIKDVYATWKGKQQAPVKRMLGLEARLQEIETNVGSRVFNLVVPPGIPVFFLRNEVLFNLFFPVNVFIYKQALKRAMRKLGFTNPIAITAYNPIFGLALLNKIGEKLHFYYCYDGVESVFFGKRIFDIEKRFTKKVQAVITTSDYLNTQKININPNSFVVKNGVDFPVFQAYSKTKVFERERKRVGFIGSLDPRFDIDTVEYAISKLADFDFDFTGDMRNQLLKSRLQKFENVRFFDPIKPNDVPKLLATYDVGIIPYIVNEVNKNIYPLKINEFLAVGVPVVMTPFADLKDFVGLVNVATDKDDFVWQLREATRSDSPESIRRRIDFASQNSWEERAQSFAEIINKYTGK